MDIELLRKRISLIASSMAGMFLAIHVGFLIIFILSGATPMIYVNIVSIVFYVAMILLVLKKRLTVFAIASYLEINAHMALAIIFTGWGAGFQITLIGIVILLFFSEYVARSLSIAYVPAIYLAPIAAAVYIVCYVVSLNYPAPYSLPQGLNIGLQIGLAVIVFVIMSFILLIFVTTTTRSQSELTNEVVHDKLTGLPNRYYMASCFQTIESESPRKNHWIAIADLDDFKSVNDEHGHNYGDYVLKAFATLLSEICSSLVVCRWGGEEFLLLGGEDTDPGEILEQVRKAVESYPFEYEGIAIHLTVTIGYAWMAEGQTVDEWINDADNRLYEGKQAGKNHVCF